MRLARLSDGTRTFWAAVDAQGQTCREISGKYHDWAPKLAAGKGEAALSISGESIPLDSLTLLPPIEPVNRVVVAGANYTKHLKEFGVEPPKQPIAFLKAYGALIGANDDIRFPPLTEQLDYEIELVAVIGSSDIDLDDPYACVLGYTVGNDVSARDLQRSGPKGIGMDLFAAKSQDKTTGVGPWIVTKDEFPAGSPALHMTLKVDEDVRQDGSSGDMTWDVGELIKFVQQRSSFAAGDILFTGTPQGVAEGSGNFLKRGQTVEATIEGIGTLTNKISS